ncbi:ATP-grasp ribosomal peptide maturase, partial [Streptomyces sp. NPDC001177]
MASTVLVVTALEDVTADRVITALNEREVPVARVDPADIGPGLAFDARIGTGGPSWAGRLVTGSREVELGEARTLVAGIPDARLAVVPGASHLVPV